jgi:predicted amidohydrolase YtcJ
MKRLLQPCLAALALAACGEQPGPAATPAPSDGADLVIRNARIWTGVADAPWASALAISGDRIVAVGGDAEINALVGTVTEVIDSPVGLVLPGFIDSHVHLMSSAFELSSVQLRDAQTPEAFAERIGEFAAALAPGEWIQGGGWDHTNWGGELPQRSWVDAVTADHPVFLSRLDGHMALANSKALQLAGIDRDTPDVEGGEIVRDPDGEPTGILKDNAMERVLRVLPDPGVAQQDQALERAMDYLLERGVTTVHTMGYDWDDMAVFRRAHQQGRLRTRIYSILPIGDWARLADEIAARGHGDDWLRIGGLKGFMDGSLGSHTAAFFEPFADTPGERGFFITPPEQMREWAIAADAAGLQLLIHAIGDRANATLLDIFAAVAEHNGARDRRFRIEHAQHLRPQDIERIAAMHVIPSMQPYHAIDDGRWADSVIGAERSRYTYAFRSLIDAGARLAFGSDWSVAPASPVLGIYAAVARQTLDGAHPDGWVPEEKITVEEALVAFTRNGAYASFEETIKGALAPGKLADVVIVDRDITAIPADEIDEATVLRTIVGGKTLYRRDQAEAAR